ncbi:MAG: hypothetical protein MUF87_21000 [Anaerolineae bacterium]|nr:hypothetical protein [Anaerolineae bacterium]
MTTTPAESFRQASIKTAHELRTLAGSPQLRQLSQLSLPEITAISDEIARVVPAGNVPGLVLSGLARLDSREVPIAETRKHVGLLFRGARQMLDKAVYGMFFAGPAAVLYGYQKLLQLAGKPLDHAFPDGTWQFYLEFALREDGARHTNETRAFHQLLQDPRLQLSDSDQLAAWVMTAAYWLQQLPAILTNEWTERTAAKLLEDLTVDHPNHAHFAQLFSTWEAQRPYGRGQDAGDHDYPTYRRLQFERFLERYLITLPQALLTRYQQALHAATQTALPAYLNQMSCLAYLDPDTHQETRVPYALEDAFIGVIWQGSYYLMPLRRTIDPDYTRATLSAIFTQTGQMSPRPAAQLDDPLVVARRSEHAALRKLLPPATLKELEALQRAPILINWDQRDQRQPLVMIRQGKRGIGDHPLTLFRTAESIVFDQSHIFFDGVWGSATAEILTRESLSWAVYYAQTAAPKPAASLPYSPALSSFPAFEQKAYQARTPVETGAENTTIQLNAIMALRKLLKQRSDMAQVTVNDLLLLYRGLHAITYTPSPAVEAILRDLQRDTRPEARQAHQLILEELVRLKGKNPALLIPIDASRFDPRERIFPTTFRNPLTDFYEHHTRTMTALENYRAAPTGNRGPEFQAFFEAQVYYLRLIAAFGELLTRYRQIALSGQSTSTASIRFLAHLPIAMQKLLDTIPTRFDVLNEVIKGEEVFSNMGRVAKGSSLTRFITAKDDNEQKTLAWGVLTDDQNVLHLSLRDFRPHVTVLHRLGMAAHAQQLTQDYLNAYADGLNRYVIQLREIVIASRETYVQR